MDERTWIEAIRKDPGKFAGLYDRYHTAIFNYILRRTGEVEASRDICSEVFLKAFKHIGRFRWRQIGILHWLYRIAGNEVRLWYRSARYRPTLLELTGSEPAREGDLLQEMIRAEEELKEHRQFLRVQQAILRLGPKYQEVITLRYFEQLRIAEISQVLNKKEGTIKSLVSRGLDRLRKELDQK